MYSTIHVDFDSLHRRMEENILKIESHRQAILKRMMAKDFQYAPRNIAQPPSQMFNGEGFFSVEMSVPGEENEQRHMRVVIQPRVRKQSSIPEVSHRSMRIRPLNDTLTAPSVPLP